MTQDSRDNLPNFQVNSNKRKIFKFNEKSTKLNVELDFEDLRPILSLYEFNVHFMEMGSFTAADRIELLDWIMDLSHRMGLTRETFYMAVYYVDRFIANVKYLSPEKHKLLGITSLFMASKIQEIYPPKPRQFTIAIRFIYPLNRIFEFEIYLMTV